MNPDLLFGQLSCGQMSVIIGDIGKSMWIDRLIESGKINVYDVKGKCVKVELKYESY